MTAPRSRKDEKRYDHYKKTVDKSICEFCDVNRNAHRLIEETPNFIVIKNDYPYSLWDHQGVADHLMITPRTHSQNLSNLSDKQKVEYVDLMEKYESLGYNIFARTPYSKMKSIPHQHTHLIKPTNIVKRFVLAINKPYIRIAK